MFEQPAADRRAFRLAGIASIAFATLLLDSLIGNIAYHVLPLHGARWLVEPVLYITHDEHSAGTPGFGTDLSTLAFLVGMIVVAAGLAYFAAAHCSVLVRIALGIAIGGALANAIQDTLTGSVTDFLGIRTTGIWSAGDISMWPAILVISAAWAASSRSVGGLPRWMVLAIWSSQIVIDVVHYEQGLLEFAVFALVICLLAALASPSVRPQESS